ncbi:MAG: pyridoxal 5'-phosphate synthase lyase subunit PdxS [Thermoplasmata archaeon]|nr:pyridoxal 5'-phosphate synthase lyase subunit PdxS [Thermoplasmata archaeon]
MPLDLDIENLKFGTELLKRGFAKMQKGGVVMDVTNREQAIIAEEAGAVAVMSLERVPADIRRDGGVARAADPIRTQEILDSVSIPVMAKARIGHFAEAQMWEVMGVDMIDESEVLTPADPFHHIIKTDFTVPFVCGATYLGEAVRRIAEGAAMIRTKGEAGTGNVIEAVRHQKLIFGMMAKLKKIDDEEMNKLAHYYSQPYGRLEREIWAPFSDSETRPDEVVFGGRTQGDWEKDVKALLLEIRDLQRLPVVNFAAGGIATPADAALMMQLGMDGVFVGSGIFKSDNPAERAKAITEAVAHFDDPKVIMEVSKGIGEAMPGINIDDIPKEHRLADRGW